MDTKGVRKLFEGGFSAALTIFVLIALILAGPANAFKINVSPADDTVLDFGEFVSFSGTVKIENKERVPVDYFILEFSDGSQCKFEPDGTPITGCSFVTINVLDMPAYNEGNSTFKVSGHKYNYGYGYGFEGSDSFSFKFSADTEHFDWGNHKYKLIAVVGSNQFKSATNTFVIREPLICPA